MLWDHASTQHVTDITATAAQFLTERVTRGQVTISPSNLRLVNTIPH